jgi:HPt (histidine-containing phosphotransfer) domain-containing protein
MSTFGVLLDPDVIAPRAKKDLAKLSSLGHFLKGSSAALGVARVQASCEKIQHYGVLRDEELGIDLTPQAATEKIKQLLVEVQADYKVAEEWLRDWFGSHRKVR